MPAIRAVQGIFSGLLKIGRNIYQSHEPEMHCMLHRIHCICWTLKIYSDNVRGTHHPGRNSQLVTMSHTPLPPYCDCVTVYAACHSPLSVMFSLNAVITLTTIGICSTRLSQRLANCLVWGEIDGLISGKLSQEKQETTDYLITYILTHLQNGYLFLYDFTNVLSAPNSFLRNNTKLFPG